jgi:uncharacterized protein YbjT (DUF2867 family)
MILVTGASGTTGSLVVRQLTERGVAVRAMTRATLDPPPGVDVVRADFDDPESLIKAVTGVDAVYLVTAAATPTPHHDLALLAAATAAGVRRVVKLSAIGTGERFDGAVIGAWHLAAEEAVRASGLEWTILRPPSFASNLLWYAAAVRAGHPIPNMTGTGRQGIIDPRDIAAVAAEALTSSVHIGQTYTLTGPELLSMPDQADILARVTGQPVGHVDLSEEESQAQLVAAGLTPEAVAAASLGMRWARAGHAELLTDTVTAVLGRKPGTLERWATEHAAAFTP